MTPTPPQPPSPQQAARATGWSALPCGEKRKRVKQMRVLTTSETCWTESVRSYHAWQTRAHRPICSPGTWMQQSGVFPETASGTPHSSGHLMVSAGDILLQLFLQPPDSQLPGVGGWVLQGPALSPEPTTHARTQSCPAADS